MPDKTTDIKPKSRKRVTAEKRSVLRRKKRSKFSALLLSLLSVIAMMAALTAATFAWFTDTAVTKGSSVVTGYMGADLYFDEKTIEDYATDYIGTLDPSEVKKLGLSSEDPAEWTPEDRGKVIGKFTSDKKIEDKDKYIRKIKKDDSTINQETYYRITDKELNVITLENVEPGQAYPVDFYVANTGQLAFTFSTGFHIEKSLTGWLRLYAEKEAGKINETDEKYKVIEKILIEEQTEKDPETGEPKKDSTGKYIDKGGHLEDVLEVYIVPDDFYKNDPGRKIREAIDKKNYIGTMAEIIGKPTESGTGKEGELPAGNRAFTGYLLPKNAVTQTIDGQDVIVPTDVEISNGETLIEKKTGVTELDKLSFLIVAPETMEDEYQYASISISLGAFTTQVEYEKDGTDCMIYDKGAHEVASEEEEYCTVTFKGIDSSGTIYEIISENGTQKVKRGEKATAPEGDLKAFVGGVERVLGRDGGSCYKDISKSTAWTFGEDIVESDVTIYVSVNKPGTH